MRRRRERGTFDVNGVRLTGTGFPPNERCMRAGRMAMGGAAAVAAKRKFAAVGITGTAPRNAWAPRNCAAVTGTVCAKFPCRKRCDETLETALYRTF